MIKTSYKKLKCMNVGTTVRIPIPDVDKARGSPRSLLAVVTDFQDGLYKLCKWLNLKMRKLWYKKLFFIYTILVPFDENFLDLKET